jgi:hypothetical protein
MTEEEAKQKWCPMVRYYDRNSEMAYNAWYDTSGGEGRCKCIGSACMMWRWDVDKCRKGPEVDHGYCGLAGKP